MPFHSLDQEQSFELHFGLLAHYHYFMLHVVEEALVVNQEHHRVGQGGALNQFVAGFVLHD